MGASHWPAMKLGDFVTLQRGHDLPEHQRKPGKVPVLGSFGITGYHDAPKAKGPGVTVGRSGASFGVVTPGSLISKEVHQILAPTACKYSPGS
jgi:hypothetical protein